MRNLRRRKQWNGLVDRLTEEKDPTTSQTAFPTLRELMCFAASLGFEQGKRTPLGEETVDFVEGRVFPRSDIALDLLYLVALASERDVSIVDDEHEEHHDGAHVHDELHRGEEVRRERNVEPREGDHMHEEPDRAADRVAKAHGRHRARKRQGREQDERREGQG